MTHRGIHVDGRPIFAAEPGPAPMLHWLPIDRLIIDEAYQRPLGRNNWLAIEKIAANFQWSRFGPVLVAPITGGLYAIIDGQHRCHAAAMCGITEVPAMVVQVGIEEQSRAFAWVNSQTIKVTLFHVYKAALAAKEDWAIRADAAVAGGGVPSHGLSS
jgi:ParB-like nuclease domain